MWWLLLVGGVLGIGAASMVLLRDRLPRQLPWRRERPDPIVAARAKRASRYFSMTFTDAEQPPPPRTDPPE